MSMTPEQMEKAEAALRRQKIKEILQRHALERRNQCIKDVPFFGLPYRILFSLETPPNQIPLSRFYPYRACRKETEEKIRAALQREREQTGELSEERIKEIQERLEAVDYTPAERRNFYFTPFLAGWDFPNFKNWDWTGNKIPQSEAVRLQEHYQRRQHDFLGNPEKYAVPALIKDDDMTRYSKETRELMEMFDNLPL